MRSAAVTAILLLVASSAAASSFSAQLPEELQLEGGMYISGGIDLDNAIFTDPVAEAVGDVGLAEGRLTVCPSESQQPAVVDVLADLQEDCDGGRFYTDATLTIAGQTSLQFAGAYPLQAMPEASAVLPSRQSLAILGSPDGFDFATPDGARFAPLSASSAVRVETEDGRVWYNGSDWAFMHDGQDLHVGAQGIVGDTNTGWILTIGEARRGPMRAVADVFSFLPLQEWQLGGDAREPRSNASALARTYGRTVDQTNGAIVGHITGNVGNTQLTGTNLLLLRLDKGSLSSQDDTIEGSVDVRLRVGDGRVAYGAGDADGSPWLIGTILWIIAVAVLVVRRHPGDRLIWGRVVRGVSWVLSIIMVDLAVVRRGLGTGALESWTVTGYSTGDRLASTAFLLVTVVWTWLLLHQPLRIAVGKWLPRGRRWMGDLGALVVWWIFILVAPASMLAAGLTWARL